MSDIEDFKKQVKKDFSLVQEDMFNLKTDIDSSDEKIKVIIKTVDDISKAVQQLRDIIDVKKKSTRPVKQEEDFSEFDEFKDIDAPEEEVVNEGEVLGNEPGYADVGDGVESEEDLVPEPEPRRPSVQQRRTNVRARKKSGSSLYKSMGR